MPSQPVAGSRIVSLGHYQPTRVVTNDELAQMVDTSDEWIRTRVGITQRRVADDETVADMAAAAAEKALAGSGFTAADIDLVVVATCSSVDRCPNVATRVAARLGIHAPGAYDINTACSGFPYALSTVDHAIRAGAARRAIVIGAEKLTDFTDWTDRSTCILFGDGAGAAVVTAVAEGEEPGIGPVLWGSAPEMGDVVVIEGWRPYIKQAGQTVFRWATTALPRARPRGVRAGRGGPGRPRRVRPPPGQPAHHRTARPQARRCRGRRGPRHRGVGQHLGGQHPAGPVEAGGAAGGRPRAPRCCCSASEAASPTPAWLSVVPDLPRQHAR